MGLALWYYGQEGCPYGSNCPYIHDEQLRERESEVIYLVPRNDGTRTCRTKMCKNWMETGQCRFGSQCTFAHEVTGQVGAGALQLASTCAANASVASVPYSYHTKARPRKLPEMAPKMGEVKVRRWKGPDKISKIYGDWIDDL